MANSTKRKIFASLGFIGSWILLFSLTYSPEPDATYLYPIAEVSGNPTGDPYQAGRLLARWQSEGGMENSLANFMAIPWGASLVLYNPIDVDDKIKLTYIGELGPDYPLMYTEEVVNRPFKYRFGYSYHRWSLEGSHLVLRSWKAWYTEWLRLVVTGLISALVYTFVFVLATEDSERRSEKS